MELKDYHTEAVSQFNEVAQDVSDDQWHNATPCQDWDVRALVTHVTREFLWLPETLSGKATEEVGDTFDGDILGDEPKAVVQQAANGAIEALSEVVGERPVHLSYGKRTAAEYIEENMCDVVVHTWDLAQGIQTDVTFSDELIDACYEAWGEADLSASGMFSAPVPVPNDADTLTKLLANTGRDPWGSNAKTLHKSE